MTSQGWFIDLSLVMIGTAVSGIVQRVWPTPGLNAKRLAYLERRVRDLSKQLGIEEAPLTEVQELIAQGRKVSAIKLYREQTGASLAAFEEAVDAMEAQMKALDLA